MQSPQTVISSPGLLGDGLLSSGLLSAGLYTFTIAELLGSSQDDVGTKVVFAALARFDFNIAAVPEPSQWALIIGGFGCVGLAARRRNNLGGAKTA